MADAVAISSTLSRQREQGGRIKPDISNLRRRNGSEREQQKNKSHPLPWCGFQEPSVVVEHMADISERPYRRCVHVSNMCAGGGTPALTPWQCSHRTRLRELHIFYFTSFSLPAARLGVFMPNFTVSRQNSAAIVAASRPE